MKCDPGARGHSRASGALPIAVAALVVWVGAAIAASAANAQQAQQRHEDAVVERDVAGDLGFLSAPPFPDFDITEAVRIQLETFAAPDASIGSGHVTVVRPELGARATWYSSERVMSRVSVQLAQTLYDFRGDAWEASVDLPPPSGDTVDANELIDDLELHAARLTLEGAYLLSDDTHWFANGERWSALGSLYGGSRWENGDFDSGLGAGGALGVGYEVSKQLRVALGLTLRSALGESDLEIDPLFSLRWRPNQYVTLRTRELGGQVEIALTPFFGVYLAGFRSTDAYRLNDRSTLGELSFRDRHIRIGGGVEWTLANWARLQLEAGALTDRQLRVKEEDRETLLSRRSDPAAYFEILIELRL